MPCNSDHMAPNAREQESQRVCQLIQYLWTALGKVCPVSMAQSAMSIYGNVSSLDMDTEILCMAIKTMSVEEQEKIIYDGHSSAARKLADWWEDHQRADQKRSYVG